MGSPPPSCTLHPVLRAQLPLTAYRCLKWSKSMHHFPFPVSKCLDSSLFGKFLPLWKMNKLNCFNVEKSCIIKVSVTIDLRRIVLCLCLCLSLSYSCSATRQKFDSGENGSLSCIHPLLSIPHNLLVEVWFRGSRVGLILARLTQLSPSQRPMCKVTFFCIKTFIWTLILHKLRLPEIPIRSSMKDSTNWMPLSYPPFPTMH